MMQNKKALLLVGSPKAENSTSASLGNYLISKLEKFGLKSETLYLHRVVNREEKINYLFQAIADADLIILSFPLYVDSLPAPVIKAMEIIKGNRDTLESKKSQKLIAISNNGFPEASQNMIALQICKVFSKECGFIWKSGLALGQGGAIHGVPLLEKKGMARNVIKGLDMAAQALKDGKEIPQESIQLFSKGFIPASFYRFFGNFGWRMQAKRNGVKHKLKDQPYS